MSTRKPKKLEEVVKDIVDGVPLKKRAAPKKEAPKRGKQKQQDRDERGGDDDGWFFI